LRQTRSGAARTGYSGFNAFAQRVFCRFFGLDAANGFDVANDAIFDGGDAIKRIFGLFLRHHPLGIGKGGPHTPDTISHPSLEGRGFGIRARMKVAERRTRRDNPSPLVAAPIFSNIIVRFFEGGGAPLSAPVRARHARLRFAASPR
jgi:hypothetical protein